MKITKTQLKQIIKEELEKVIDEQAPGSQVFAPGSDDGLDKYGSDTSKDIGQGETSDPSAYLADIVKNLSSEQLAIAIALEGVRVMAKATGQNHQPYEQYEDLGAEPPPPPYVFLNNPSRAAFSSRGDRKHMLDYIRNLGLDKNGKFAAPPELADVSAPLRSDRSGKGLESAIMKATWGENLPNEAYMNGNMPKAQKKGMVKPHSIKDPISGDTFTFTPMLSRSGLVHSVKIG